MEPKDPGGDRAETQEARLAASCLRCIVEGTAAATGETFFQSLVRQLAAALKVRFALVGERAPDGPDRMSVLAVWAGDQFGERFVYDLAGTPCERVVAAGACVFPRDVRRLFPEDRLLAEMGIESYVGTPLLSSKGEVLGILVLMDDGPMADTALAQTLLAIFAARAGAELERSRGEAALRESEERFRQLAESSRQVFWMTTPDKDRMLYVGPAYEEVWGRSCAGLYASPRSWIEAIHPEDRERVARAASSKQAEGTYSEEYRIVRPDGTVRWILDRAFPVRDAGGTVYRLAGVAEDITERKAAEEALRVKTAQLEAIGDAMVRFLEEGNWQEVSVSLLRAAVDLTGSRYGFIGVMAAGSSFRILAHEGVEWDGAVNREFYERAERTYREKGYLEFTNLDNLFGRVLTTGQPVLSNDPAGDPRAGGLPPGHPPLRSFLGVPLLRGAEVVGMIGVANRSGGYSVIEQARVETLARAAGVVYDSYRRQQREVALEDQLRQAQKLEAIGRLAGGVAHDFNNLLTVINGYSTLLAEALGPDSPLRQAADEIAKAGDKAAELTSQLLAFSRRQVLQPRVLDLNAVVGDLASLLRRLLGEHVELRLNLAPHGAFVKADPGQLAQVLMNLAVNARDAMPQGGTLTVATDPEASAAPAPVLLTVADTGMGMDAETRAHLFEPFFTNKAPGKGTGLGLATVYGILQQSGGSIEVESAPGAGTTFRIRLPRADPAGAAPTPEQAREPVGRGEGILLVEDTDAVRTLTAEVLRRGGYRVFEARNGAEALGFCRSREAPLRLLLTDVVMPGMTGRELAERATALLPGLAVLYMSGYTQDILAPYGILPSDRAILRKPFHHEELLRRIADLLRAPGPPEPGADPVT